MFLTSLQDKVKRIQELRRSNAAQPVRNKKKYTRKIKHKNNEFNLTMRQQQTTDNYTRAYGARKDTAFELVHANAFG